jgi:hypothetical protein
MRTALFLYCESMHLDMCTALFSFLLCTWSCLQLCFPLWEYAFGHVYSFFFPLWMYAFGHVYSFVFHSVIMHVDVCAALFSILLCTWSCVHLCFPLWENAFGHVYSFVFLSVMHMVMCTALFPTVWVYTWPNAHSHPLCECAFGQVYSFVFHCGSMHLGMCTALISNLWLCMQRIMTELIMQYPKSGISWLRPKWNRNQVSHSFFMWTPLLHWIEEMKVI